MSRKLAKTSRSARVAVLATVLPMIAMLSVVSTSTASAAPVLPNTSTSHDTATRGDVPADPKPQFHHHGSYQNLDLHGLDLHGRTLHHSHFQGAVMHHSNFRHATMHRSHFEKAVMHHAIFAGATMHSSRFDGSVMHHSNFRRSVIHHSHFERTLMHHSHFESAVMHHSHFEAADLSKSRFERATMHHSSFRGANLTGVTMYRADLRKSNFGRMKKTHKSARSAWGSPSAGAVLSGANLGGANLSGSVMSGATLSGTNLGGANLSGVNFTGANISNTNFEGANLNGANLSGLNLTSSNLTGANLSGANLSGAQLPTSANSRTFCSDTLSNYTMSNGVVVVNSSSNSSRNNGVVPSNSASGSATISGPNGISLTASYKCNRPTSWTAWSWTITVTGTTGTFSTPLRGLSVGFDQVSGTIRYDASSATTSWNVTAPFQLTKGAITVTGSFAISSDHSWTITASGGSGSLADAEDTYTLNSFSGSLSYSAGTITGSLTLNRTSNGAALTAIAGRMPSGWTFTSTLSAHVVTQPTNFTPADATLAMTFTGTSSSGLDTFTWTGDWSASGYQLTGAGQYMIGQVPVTTTGTYSSKGYPVNGTPLRTASWSVTANMANVSLGTGGTIVSGSLSASNGSTGITGALLVAPAGASNFAMNMNATFVSSTNWSLTATGTSPNSAWTNPALPGLSINPNLISGSISSDGSTGVWWNLTIGSVTWNMGSGMSITTGFTLGNSCPLSPPTGCGTATGPFFGIINTSFVTGTPAGTITAQGAFSVDGSWMLFQGASGNVSFTGPGGGTIAVTNPVVTIWKGPRPDCLVSGVGMPDLTTQAHPFGVEFSGTFNANIPGFATHSVGGCIDWSNAGIAIGQVNVGGASANGTTVNGVTEGTSSVGGIAWTNLSLPTPPTISLSGTVLSLVPNRVNLSGSVSMPAALRTAIGMSGSAPSIPATGWFTLTGSSINDLSFNLTATLPINLTSGGFTLQSVAFSMSKVNSSYSLALTVNAFATLNGQTIQLTGTFAAATGGGISLSLAAKGTLSNGQPCNCDGVNTPLTNPQTGYRYISDSFFGIAGVHLWAVTATIEYIDGLPGMGISSTTYYDPTTAPMFQGTTWLQGGSTVNISDTHPCFQFGFDGTGTTTYMQIKGGVFRTSQFYIQIAPSGCTLGQKVIQPGSTIEFQTAFGDDASLTIDLAVDATAGTFYESVSVANVNLGGFDFELGQLTINITPSSQSVTFAGDFTSNVGTLNSSFNMTMNGSSLHMKGNVTLTDWSLTSGAAWSSSSSSPSGFSVTTLSYTMDTDISNNCTNFSTLANGTMNLGPKTGLNFSGSIAYNCGTLSSFSVLWQYYHGGSETDFNITYANGIFTGLASFSYEKETSKTIASYKYVRHASMDFTLNLYVNTNDSSKDYFKFMGTVSGSDISGSLDFTIAASGDDSGHASIDIHKDSTVKWSDSWNW